ncbi:MAG: phage tail assembly chaperone [Sphingomonadales bacterium]|nr:MAG: phage tail assembly chaperone [Sphingomonadales bacterium]
MKAAAARSVGAEPQPFPWDAALHFGLGLLRLSPDVFWALSLRELSALGGALRPVQGIDRTGLGALMKRWPDEVAGADQSALREQLTSG